HPFGLIPAAVYRVGLAAAGPAAGAAGLVKLAVLRFSLAKAWAAFCPDVYALALALLHLQRRFVCGGIRVVSPGTDGASGGAWDTAVGRPTTRFLTANNR